MDSRQAGDGVGYLDRPWLRQYPSDVPREVEVPEVPVTRLIDEAIAKYATETAINFYGTRISYATLGQYIERMASALHEVGVTKGTVVAIYLPNCPQFIIAYYAALKLGAIPMAVSFLFSPREIKLQLEDSGANYLVMIDLLYAKTKPIIRELGIETVIVTDILSFMPYFKRTMARLLKKSPKATISKTEPVVQFEALLKKDTVTYPPVEIDAKKDLASIIYTSGTTGDPKGVEITHYNIVAMREVIKAGAGVIFEESRYVLAYLPFFHVYGQNFILTGCLSLGQTLIVVLRPVIKDLLRYIEKYRLTLLFGVPAFFRMLITEIKKGRYDLSSLRMCACGSDYTPQSLKDEWTALTGTHITEGYGLTEAIPATGTVIGASSEAESRTGSIGIPMPGIDVAIADPEAAAFVPVGELGEIVIHGPVVTRGYWTKGRGNMYPDAFEEIGGMRWLRSGDLGHMDADGYFYMTDRKKNIIKYKAHMIYPGEIEEVIAGYEPVAEVAVVGVQANEVEFGQIVKAFIVLKDAYKGAVTADDVLAYCHDKLAVYKRPKAIAFIDALPKNALGKVVRKDLREET